MRKHHLDNQQQQSQLAERRARVDNETSSPMHPPRTVAEQVEELDDSGPGDHRRRDPLGAAQSQQEPRDEVSGGGPGEGEGSGEGSGTRQRFGSDVQTGPARADADAD